MVTKLDLGLLGIAAFAVFLIVRGGGKFLEGLNPFGQASDAINEAGAGIGDFFGDVGAGIGNFFGGLFPDGDEVQPPPEDVDVPPDSDPPVEPEPDFFKQIQDTIFNFFSGIGGIGGDILGGSGDTDTTSQENQEGFNVGGDLLNIFGQQQAFAEEAPVFVPETQVQQNLGTEQQFFGGGPSFVGGSVTETPIANLTLNQIIEKFGVGATEAADILARARDDFGNFDFDGNTGSGIGSVFEENPNLQSILPADTPNVSDSQFEGLSAEQIFQQLVGGNISNF